VSESCIIIKYLSERHVHSSKDTRICVWDRTTRHLHRKLVAHDGPVNAIGIQDNRVASVSGDGKMILWDIISGEKIRTFEGHERGLACVVYKGDMLISGSNDKKIKVWDARYVNILGSQP
jgi:F-box and WD-40 domain protein 1/11